LKYKLEPQATENIAREAWRTNLPTAHPNQRKYARCEWKCIAFIGTDGQGKIANEAISRDVIHHVSAKRPKPVPINAIHCSGQRGDYRIENDTRRPNHQ